MNNVNNAMPQVLAALKADIHTQRRYIDDAITLVAIGVLCGIVSCVGLGLNDWVFKSLDLGFFDTTRNISAVIMCVSSAIYLFLTFKILELKKLEKRLEAVEGQPQLLSPADRDAYEYYYQLTPPPPINFHWHMHPPAPVMLVVPAAPV